MGKRSTAAQGEVRLGTDPIYDLRQISPLKAVILGLQHMFAMFGATVLVPLLTGLDVSTTLFMAGCGTLVFHFCTRGKVPAFLGSSFAFLGGYAAVAPLQDGVADPVKLAYAGGGVAISGLVYILLAALIRLFGVQRVMRFFPPVVTGPIIISIGLILAPTAIANCQTNWTLALVAIVVVVVCNIWGRGMIKIVPVMMGIIVAYGFALLTGALHFSDIVVDKAFGIPLHTAAFARFEISSILTILPISLATIMEHIGDVSAIGATTGRNYIAHPGLNRTLLGDGLATSLSALFGGPANTTYGENTGVLVLTKVYDPKVTRIAAYFAILLSFFPIVSAVIRSIPAAIIGGVSLILYGMISAIGVRNVVENQVDFTKSRNLIIAACVLVTALGFNAIGGLGFEVGGVQITLSGLALAAIVGVGLNAILPGKDYIFSVEEPKDTGVNFSAVDTSRDGTKLGDAAIPVRKKENAVPAVKGVKLKPAGQPEPAMPPGELPEETDAATGRSRTDY